MTTTTKTMTYAYAVMDGNQAPDQFRMAASCHHSIEAARKAAAKLNRGDPNAHYYVIHWGSSRWARERPAPKHPKGL